jgi:signal transduction histidine kinase
MTDPVALMSALTGGAVAVVTIAALRPRQQRVAEPSSRSANEPTVPKEEPVRPAEPVIREASSDAAIVREIAHSLNTPLAQIETTLLTMEPGPEENRDKVGSMLDATRICKSFLAAFREVATLSRDADTWEPASLSASLTSAAGIYGTRSAAQFTLHATVPEGIPGYDNNYLLALALPILENAIEAVTPAGSVGVACRLGETNIIQISNDASITELTDEIYEAGYTSCKDGHSGFGLAVVRRLLSARPGATLRHEVRGGQRVVFTIELPRRRQA